MTSGSSVRRSSGSAAMNRSMRRSRFVPVVPRVMRPTGPLARAMSPGYRRLNRLDRMTYTLILVRHGNSEWNQKNLFTGWVDVRLTEQGIAEAKRAGQLLAESGLKPTVLHTSLLTRAIQTANLALE